MSNEQKSLPGTVGYWIAALPADRRVPWSYTTSLVTALARLGRPPRAVALNARAWINALGETDAARLLEPTSGTEALLRGSLALIRIPDVVGVTELWGTSYLHPSHDAHAVWTSHDPQLLVLG